MKNEMVLHKMCIYVEKLIAYCSGYTYESFMADIKLVEACVFNLSQIGELCRLVDEVFTLKVQRPSAELCENGVTK